MRRPGVGRRRVFYSFGVIMVVAVAAVMVLLARNRTLTPEQRAAR